MTDGGVPSGGVSDEGLGSGRGPASGPIRGLAAVADPERLAALKLLAILDTPADAAFDRLSRLATRILLAPVALVSLVDEGRVFFKSYVGLPEPWASLRESPLTHAFCQHVVGSGEPLVIRDAREEPLVRDSPAIPDMGVLAYAGIPLTTPEGYTIGTFCLIDSVPRDWQSTELDTLADLAASVMTEIEARATARRFEQHARELERERATLAGVMASMTDGLVVMDAARHIRYCNDRARALLGDELIRLLDQPASVVFDAIRHSFADPDVAQTRWRRALIEVDDHPSFEFGLLGPPRRDVQIQFFPVANPAGAGRDIGMVLRDVTAERTLARAKDQVVSMVGHDLRTPLTSLVGFGELLLHEEFSAEERREYLSLMVGEGRRLEALLGDFVDLQLLQSGRRSVRPEPVDLGELLGRAALAQGPDPLRPIVVDCAALLPSVVADPGRLLQVLGNLLSNARRYSPGGGPITLSARRSGSDVEIAVRDRGLGIPPEAIASLFEPFQRIDDAERRSIGGTGLGLAICREIVAAHGGRIWAESAGRGQGSCFHVTLPVTTDH